MKWNDDKSLFLTRIFVWISAAALIVLCVGAPWIFSWFIRERMILSPDSRNYFLATTYTVAIPAAAALYMMNRLLALIGIDGPGWLTDYYWAKPAFIIIGLWGAMGGTNMLLYLAGLQNIPQELYEAAEVDGANRIQRFWHITVPMLAPTSFFIFVMSVIGGFQGGFDTAFLLTEGGPAGSTTTLSYYIYNHAFVWFNMGYAATISLTLFALVLLITLLNWRFGGKNDAV